MDDKIINLQNQPTENFDHKRPAQPELPKKTSAAKKRLRKRKIIGVFLTFLLTAGIVFSNQVTVSEQGSFSWLSNLPLIKQIRNLAESADRKLKGEERDRINILLLGIGGSSHEGGLLTDTIILFSLEPSTKKVALISVPRDLSIPTEDHGNIKVNAINAYAEMEQEESGGLAVSQALSDIFNTPIDYYVRVDFKAFTELIDMLGGITVNVENTFDDYGYPIKGMEDAQWEQRFEHLHFDKGPQKMDGSLALKYARSRHGTNGEGSDFARAKRQQNIILAVKNELLSAKTFFNPVKLSELYQNYQENVSTNLKIWEMLKLWEYAKDINRESITNRVLDNSQSGLLIDGRSDIGAYILKPRSGDFNEIQYFVNNIFTDAPKELKARVAQERATVEVRNGTWVNGLASQTALDLEKYGFLVVKIGNSSQQNFQKSVIYDLTYGEKNQSLGILKEKTGANIALGLPQWLVDEIDQENDREINPIQPDFIFILGQDADKSESGTVNQEESADLLIETETNNAGAAEAVQEEESAANNEVETPGSTEETQESSAD